MPLLLFFAAFLFFESAVYADSPAVNAAPSVASKTDTEAGDGTGVKSDQAKNPIADKKQSDERVKISSAAAIPPATDSSASSKKNGFGSEKWMGLGFALVFLIYTLFRLSRVTDEGKDHRYWIAIGIGLTLAGHGIGLFVAPKEAMMGDVGRILYVHVPTAWAALVAYLIAFALAVGSLWTGKRPWDAALAATVEVGVLYNVLLTIQGSIWAKPTWNTWWTWDPRLTTTAIMVISFAGLLILRSLLQNPERRQLVTAVGAIIAFVNVPIVYMSVKWWSSLHQTQSSAETVSTTMHLPLRLAAFGMIILLVGFIIARAKIVIRHLNAEAKGDALPEKTSRSLSV